ncbi:MAG: Unknown protein [uncultured Sulfurovum sp.]|uniref:Uncharacterized protein n=1 Tax=uncultured Sulfurovum sp. TaxID=269237 RepID=A0A6S6SVW4_9BACT|nr:MAG: Unknown protein [uncultured Sulfurovum sp.]
MSKITTKLDNSMPIFERLAKIKKLFSSSTTFWTVTRIFPVFIISQFIALAWNEKFSENVMGFFKDAPEWSKSFIELCIAYFEKSGDWLYVGISIFIIILLLIGKYFDTKSIPSEELKKISDTQEKILENKNTENYLVKRIEQLEVQLLQSISVQETERLIDEVSSLKLELLALQINDKVINEAQTIIESEAKEGVPKALELIEKNNPNRQIVKLREQMQKQAKISRYKASLYEWINQWEKADTSYQEAIEFAPNNDNYFEYAYFLQVHRADFKKADKFYRMALDKTESLVKKATILNNLANFHAEDSTKRTEALSEYEEALKIYRALVKENPKVYLPDVAMTLNNLANFHSDDSTKRTEALSEYEEALKIRRALAKENPKVYLPDVAMTLNNLGLFHAEDSTKRTEALSEYEEALKIYRALAKENPKVYLPYVAGSLNNLANFYSKDSTKRTEALSEYEEALKIYRALAKENPKVYLPYVAGSLNNLGLFHAEDSTKCTEALSEYEEALKIYRALAKENPKVYGEDCAKTLVMGVYLFGANKMQLDEALELLEPYPDNYGSVGGLRQMILQLKEAR